MQPQMNAVIHLTVLVCVAVEASAMHARTYLGALKQALPKR